MFGYQNKFQKVRTIISFTLDSIFIMMLQSCAWSFSSFIYERIYFFSNYQMLLEHFSNILFGFWMMKVISPAIFFSGFNISALMVVVNVYTIDFLYYFLQNKFKKITLGKKLLGLTEESVYPAKDSILKIFLGYGLIYLTIVFMLLGGRFIWFRY